MNGFTWPPRRTDCQSAEVTFARRGLCVRRRIVVGLLSICWMMVCQVSAADLGSGGNQPEHFDVSGYVVHGTVPFSETNFDSIFARHTGTNVSIQEIVQAAKEAQSEFAREGHPATGVAVGEDEITNGIVTLNVFECPLPQIVVSGRPYLILSNFVATVTNAPVAATNVVAENPLAAVTNAVPPATLIPVPHAPAKPITSEEMARAKAELLKKMAEATAEEKDTRVHVVCTNSGPRFDVKRYIVSGDTLLTPPAIDRAITNIDGAFGTNVCFEGIQTVVEQLQKAYNDRGYGLTVNVGLPQQTLSNATVKVQVTEGRLAAITVKGNQYFSSNNVMRALPDLRTNMILNSQVFQADLNQANANQDRQIYPVIGPGPDPGTSELTLNVKDHLPLHAKTELNNEYSPGTPVLRVNSSAAYQNLWQLEHAVGLQYAFSPEAYKGGDWNFLDRPVVANYGGFYRLPLGGPESVQKVISSNPDNFGYSEETRKFTLPPPSGRTELTIYANRSTTDPGVQTLSSAVLFNNPGVREVTQRDVQQDITINDTIGLRLNKPLPEAGGIRSILSGGLDFKKYSLTDYKTNIFSFIEITRRPDGSLNPPIISSVSSPVPVTDRNVQYLPLTLSYSGTMDGDWGTATMGLGVTGNPWFFSAHGMASVTGSSQSSGYWVTVTPSFSWTIPVHPGWPLMINANGQWASEPLVSTEQFGVGGVNSVRGYKEGELFGDEGWRISVEQQTPGHVIGMVYGNVPLTVSGSIYMDFARAMLIDPQGRQPAVSLWGTGVGVTASVGSHWGAQLLFSVPLSGTANTEAMQPHFNFSLTAQF